MKTKTTATLQTLRASSPHPLKCCCDCSLTGPAESVSLTQLKHKDTGLSRLFLWWVWNQGLPVLQQRLKPRVRQSHRAYLEQQMNTFQRWLCKLLRINVDAGELLPLQAVLANTCCSSLSGSCICCQVQQLCCCHIGCSASTSCPALL